MTGTLSQKLIPRLLARFGTLGVRIHDGKQPVATFPALHADVGDLNIYDDDMELMVDVGNLTHGHFLPRNHEAPQEEREEEVIEQVMAFLDAVFDDQIEFWRSDIGRWLALPWWGRADRPERTQIYMVWSTKWGVAQIV